MQSWSQRIYSSESNGIMCRAFAHFSNTIFHALSCPLLLQAHLNQSECRGAAEEVVDWLDPVEGKQVHCVVLQKAQVAAKRNEQEDRMFARPRGRKYRAVACGFQMGVVPVLCSAPGSGSSSKSGIAAMSAMEEQGSVAWLVEDTDGQGNLRQLMAHHCDVSSLDQPVAEAYWLI